MYDIWSKIVVGDDVHYCPQCDIITVGMYKEHYCKGNIELGRLNETYTEQLERQLQQSQVDLNLVIRANKLLAKDASYLEVYEIYTGVSKEDLQKEYKRLKKEYSKKGWI